MPQFNRILLFFIAVICLINLATTTVYAERKPATSEKLNQRENSDQQVALGQHYRVAVVMEINAPSRNEPESGLSFALAIGLDSYVDYFLSRKGFDFKLFRADSTGLAPSFIQSLTDSGFTTIVTLQPAGKFTTDRIPLLDKRRRQYFESVPEQLRLSLHYRVSSLRAGKWDETGSGTVKARPRHPWLIPPSGPSNRAIDSLISVTPEPIEFIIMRSVQQLFGRINLSERRDSQAQKKATPATTAKAIPTTIVYDALSSSENENWRESTGQLVDYVNHMLKQQLNVVMSPVIIKKDWLGHGGVEPLATIFKRLESQYPPRSDTLVIGLYGERRSIDFFRLRDFDAVGFGQRGGGRALVKLFPSTRKEMENWRPFLTGRSLIHELGHVFGGIHTSDLNSIMNHSATWLSPGHFDPLNREIIRAALSGELTVSDPVSYARFLSSTILRLQYRLADFPPVFFRLLSKPKNNQKRMRQAIGSELFFLSAQGYGALREGKLSIAAKRFRKSVRLAPEQASLYYYLSLCTQGSESSNAVNTSARLGYNLAREKIRIRNSRKQLAR